MKRARRTGERGQALVEFSLAITIFLVLMMGIIDLGRAVYQLNGVAEAARELARVASVHPGAPLGTSAQLASALGGERGLVPGLGTPVYTCTSVSGSSVTGTCHPGSWVHVSIGSTFIAVTPIATLLGPIVLAGSASARIE